MASGSGDGSLATSHYSPSPPGRSRVHVVKHCTVSEEALLSFKVSPVPASLRSSAHGVQCIDSSPSVHETKYTGNLSSHSYLIRAL